MNLLEGEKPWEDPEKDRDEAGWVERVKGLVEAAYALNAVIRLLTSLGSHAIR